MIAVAIAFVRLRWRLLRGAVRHGGSEQVGAIVSTVASFLIGLGTAAAVFVAGRTGDDAEVLAVLFCSLVLVAAVGFGIVAGISQPIDPRVVAAEPISDRDRAVGLLAAASAGPPGLAGITVGIGLGAGVVTDVAAVPVTALAVTSWLIALLLLARTVTNLLAMLASRFPRAGQLVVGLAGLVFYGLFQFVPALLNRLDDEGRQRLGDALAWTPPGQIGRALADGNGGWLHVVAGSIWLPILAVTYAWTARELALTVRRTGGGVTQDAAAGPLGRVVRRACGDDAAGAVAWRSILVRFRTPRTALETFTGAGVGMAAVLVPALIRDDAGSGAVLVGGAVQLAVLFMAGNSFGTDGPALTHELLTGTGARRIVAGKARSILIVAAPLAVIGPLLAASVTAEWEFLPAGLGVGLAGLLAGTGAAVVQSAVVPIAIPESDNPFAGGESGKGIVAALLLGLVLAALALVTVPVALALLWATDRRDVGLVTAFAVVAVGVGWALLRVGIGIATARVSGREPEFVASLTPAR